MPVQASAMPFVAPKDPTKLVIRTGEMFERFYRWIKDQPVRVLDYETSGTAYYAHAKACGVALGSWHSNGQMYNAYIPVRHRTGEQQLSMETIAPAMKQLLGDPYATTVAHNLGFEDHFSRKEGWSINGGRFCTLIGAKLFDENRDGRLKVRAVTDLGHEWARHWEERVDRELNRLKKAHNMNKTDYLNKYGYSQLPVELAGLYACWDTEFAGGLFKKYTAWGITDRYPRIWRNEMRLTKVLTDMEETGLLVDVDYLVQLRARVRHAKIGFEREIHKDLQQNMFDLSKDEVLRHYLTVIKNLPLTKKTKNGAWSVDREVLDFFAPAVPVLALIGRWRDANKIDTTYTTSILSKLDGNRRVHCSFKQTGTNCMPAGELVLTDRGYLPVEQVTVGDQVITHAGRTRPVIDTIDNGIQPIREVTLRTGAKLRTTPNHQYLTHRGWVRAQDLFVGDKVVSHTAKEWWSAVKGWWDFEASSWGRVRNKKTNNILTQKPKGRWGHLKVCLYRNGAQQRGPDRKDVAVHRIIAKAFNVPGSGPEVRHLNGIAWDNTVQNLRWGTRKQNAEDAVKHGTMSRRNGSQNKLTQEVVDEIRATTWVRGNDGKMAGRFGVSRELVRDVRLGKRWAALPTTSEAGVLFGSTTIQTIEDLDAEVTYGLTVEEDHSHVTGGMVTHNTGRLSSAGPNLQNISNDDLERMEDGVDPWSVRRLFAVPKGRVRLFLDYSQVELRVLAKHSNDKIMVQAFLDGEDLHSRAAMEVFGNAEKEARRVGKVINFGLSYCMTEIGFARNAKIPVDEAAVRLKKFFERYAGVYQFRKDFWAQVYTNGGEFQNRFGRPRRVPNILSPIGWQARRAQRQAIGSLIQGEAAELTRESLCRIDDMIRAKGYDAELVNTVHDEIQIDADPKCQTQLIKDCSILMEDFPEYNPVPIIVDAEVSTTNWAEKKAV